MTLSPDEASARARDEVWYAGMRHKVNWVPDESEIDKTRQDWETALDALVRLERARARYEAIERAQGVTLGTGSIGPLYTAGWNAYAKYVRKEMLAAAQAELTAAITALDTATPARG